MANTSLRAYLRKIEAHLENHAIEDGISMSRKILEKYPKNLQTYKSLGKLFLDKQDHNLAEKIFDIVLGVDPDDFVSHIGKSIIAESRDDLKNAVIQMKLAYELQPGNENLLEEVKRLIAKKDSVELKEIILTRGTLIKMYMRGNLFNQAISEIRIGMHENPNRIDYKVNLAQCLYKTGSLINAVETCIEIIAVMPYCLVANAILDDVVTQSADNKEQSIYKSRLIDLDPYFAFVENPFDLVNDVPDIAITFDEPSDELSEGLEWNVFIDSAWKKPDSIQEQVNFPDDINWNEIISKATSDVASKKFSVSTDAPEVIIQDEPQENISVKDDRIESVIEDIEKSSIPESEIPDWLVEAVESKPAIMDYENNGEIESEDFNDQEPIREPSDTEILSEEEVKRIRSKRNRFIERLRGIPQSKPDQPDDANDIPEWVFDKTRMKEELKTSEYKNAESILPTRSEKISDEDNLNVPMISPNETGAADADVSINPELLLENEKAESEWVSSEISQTDDRKSSDSLKLDDTQRVVVTEVDVNELLIDAEKAITNGNVNYAKNIFIDLIHKKTNLKLVASKLEQITQQKPDLTDFLILLGKAYILLGKKEKALDIFQLAGEKINF